MVGVLQLLLGVLRMGFLVNFLSIPVVSGFTSAAAILIGLSQLKHLLGVPLQGGSNAWTVIAQLPEHWGNISVETLVLGISAILLLFVFKKKFPKLPGPLFVVSLGAIIVSSLGLPGRINIVGDVPSGLPKFSLLAIDFDLVATLVPTALSIALVAFMESIAVSKTYAKKGRYNLSANRELMALGASNLLGSFFSGYPVTGGFSRTAVNAQAGAQTQLSAVFTSFFVGLSLVFLTPLFYFLPKAALASIIMVAVFGLIDYAEVTRLLRVKRSDLVLLVLTFAATLSLGAAPGLGVGVVASLGWFIYKSTQPHLAVLGRVPGTSQFRNIKRFRGLVTYRETLIVRLDAQFYFGNVAFLKDSLAELEASMPEPLQALILDASAINAIDSSAEVALRDLVEDYTARGVVLYLAGVKGPVRDVLQDSGLAVQLGAAGRCLSVHEALQSIGATPNTEPPSPSSAVGENGREVSGASARL
jgi:SulP family sulfate permease